MNNLHTEPYEVYARKRWTHLSSHMLADFRKSPAIYKARYDGELDKPDSAALSFGRAFHTLILEGEEKFSELYAYNNYPINDKTEQPYGVTTKTVIDWAGDKTPLHPDMIRQMFAMDLSIRRHDCAQRIFSDGVAEGVCRGEYCDMLCQARIDWVHNYPQHGFSVCIDLKTCANLDDFERDISRYGYIYQMAFYVAMLRHVAKIRSEPRIVAVEKSPPYRVGVWAIDPALLQKATNDNEQAIRELKSCQENNTWPTGYECLRVIEEETQ